MKRSFKKFIYNSFFRVGSLLFFFRRIPLNRSKVKKILIVSLFFRGDLLFQIPAIRVLKSIFPDAQVDVWVKSRSAGLLENNPRVSNVLIFDDLKTSSYNDDTRLNLSGKYNFFKKILSEKYDLYVDLTGQHKTALIAFLGNFKYSIGLNYHYCGFLYNSYANIDTRITDGHLIEKFSDIVRLGLHIDHSEWSGIIKKEGLIPEVYISDEIKRKIDIEFLTRGIDSSKPLICLHISAGWDAKKWDIKNFRELIRILSTQYSFNIIIVGEIKDRPIINEIISGLSTGLSMKNIFFCLPLLHNAEVIRRSDVFIGSDSAPLHIAGAVDVPSIGLFGPTNPEFSRPIGTKHIIIYKKLFCSAPSNHQYCTRNAGRECPTIDCMKNITVSEVIENIIYLLSKYSNKKPEAVT